MIEDDLAIRLNYHGGSDQQDRMIRDKLWSLKQALRGPSYHRATAILSDGREFYCLMNPSKLNADIDYKEISIPFRDVCLNEPRVGTRTEGYVDIPMECGDIFTWKETETDWLVYVQRIDELAYFRAGCYKCNIDVQFGDYTQRGHIIGPSVRNEDWRQYVNAFWNNINYDAILILPKTDEVMKYLKRFNKLTIEGKQWEVQARNMFLKGIIEIAIKEDFQNTIAFAQREPDPVPIPAYNEPYIKGPIRIDCFGKYLYEATNTASNGTWTIVETNMAKILNISSTGTKIMLGITSKKSGTIHLQYTYTASGEEQTIETILTVRSI